MTKKKKRLSQPSPTHTPDYNKGHYNLNTPKDYLSTCSQLYPPAALTTTSLRRLGSLSSGIWKQCLQRGIGYLARSVLGPLPISFYSCHPSFFFGHYPFLLRSLPISSFVYFPSFSGYYPFLRSLPISLSATAHFLYSHYPLLHGPVPILPSVNTYFFNGSHQSPFHPLSIVSSPTTYFFIPHPFLILPTTYPLLFCPLPSSFLPSTYFLSP